MGKWCLHASLFIPVSTLIGSGSALFAQICLSENLGSLQYLCVHVTDVEDPEVFEQLLNNEKENFKLLFKKVSCVRC